MKNYPQETLKRMLEVYKRNEALNAHSENLVLLANAFGTVEEQLEADRQAQSKRS